MSEDEENTHRDDEAPAESTPKESDANPRDAQDASGERHQPDSSGARTDKGLLRLSARLQRLQRQVDELQGRPENSAQPDQGNPKHFVFPKKVSDKTLTVLIARYAHKLDTRIDQAAYQHARWNEKRWSQILKEFREALEIQPSGDTTDAEDFLTFVSVIPQRSVPPAEFASLLNVVLTKRRGWARPGGAIKDFLTELGILRGARKTPDVANPLYEIEADRITAGKRAVGLGIVAMAVGLCFSQSAVGKATELYWGLEYLVAKGASPVAAADNIRLFAYITKMVASALPGALGVYIFIRMAVLSKSFFFPSHLLRASDHEREALEGEQDDVSEALSGVASHAKRAGPIP